MVGSGEYQRSILPLDLDDNPRSSEPDATMPKEKLHKTSLLCYAVACPHLKRSGMSTACPRSASAHLYHADGRLTSCDGAATDCI